MFSVLGPVIMHTHVDCYWHFSLAPCQQSSPPVHWFSLFYLSAHLGYSEFSPARLGFVFLHLQQNKKSMPDTDYQKEAQRKDTSTQLNLWAKKIHDHTSNSVVNFVILETILIIVICIITSRSVVAGFPHKAL